ncbi:hypothetical protein [Sphingomonas sp.]|uniref:hypothetical protein n=1 Tax=Sphingomonas sp. TaxID=28214 RepID=UPI001EC828DB|nr:hypothetical protein [Sphingomonas sp.]MBX3593920.1 hypothetical protein [Sphingomonas sp.]
MRFRSIPFLFAAPALLSAPAAAQPACITGPEAESLFQVMLPDTIREMGRVCAGLPPQSFLRRPDPGFLARIDAGVAPALPGARAGIRKLLGPGGEAIAESQFAVGAVRAIFAPAIAQRIRPADCPGIDRAVANLAPLPPRNLAAVFVALAQIAQTDEKRGPRLPLCPMAPAR